jgi:hypothetical protein
MCLHREGAIKQFTPVTAHHQPLQTDFRGAPFCEAHRRSYEITKVQKQEM